MVLSEAEQKRQLCWAGRWAFFGGQWMGIPPCPLPPIHVIGGGNNEVIEIEIHLCDPHFQQVNAAGLVDQPFEDPEKYKRRRRRGGR